MSSVVGAEPAGVQPAASISLAAGLALSFVRNAGYRGHEIDYHRPEGRRLRLV